VEQLRGRSPRKAAEFCAAFPACNDSATPRLIQELVPCRLSQTLTLTLTFLETSRGDPTHFGELWNLFKLQAVDALHRRSGFPRWQSRDKHLASRTRFTDSTSMVFYGLYTTGAPGIVV